MRNPPKEVSDSWPPPNYINPESQGPGLPIATIALVVIAMILVGMRVYVRRILICSWGWDDLFMILALPPAIVLAIGLNMTANYGMGRHLWDNRPEWLVPYWKWTFSNMLMVMGSSSLTKISILCSYLRISATIKFTWIVRATLIFQLGWSMVVFFVFLLTCRPISYYWTVSQHRCRSERPVLYVGSTLNVLTDIFIFVLPIPILWTLRQPARQKIILVILMGCGGMACVSGAAKIYYMWRSTYDITWDDYTQWVLGMTECLTGIICGTIATLRPLVKIYFPKLLGTNNTGPAGHHGDCTRPSFVDDVEGAHKNEETMLVTIGSGPYSYGRTRSLHFSGPGGRCDNGYVRKTGDEVDLAMGTELGNESEEMILSEGSEQEGRTSDGVQVIAPSSRASLTEAGRDCCTGADGVPHAGPMQVGRE